MTVVQELFFIHPIIIPIVPHPIRIIPIRIPKTSNQLLELEKQGFFIILCWEYTIFIIIYDHPYTNKIIEIMNRNILAQCKETQPIIFYILLLLLLYKIIK